MGASMHVHGYAIKVKWKVSHQIYSQNTIYVSGMSQNKQSSEVIFSSVYKSVIHTTAFHMWSPFELYEMG